MSGLRERLAEAIGRVDLGGPFPSNERKADAAILALRQWMDAEGLVVVPREATVGMFKALTESWGDNPDKRIAIGQWALGSFREDYIAMIAAAPDPLGDGPDGTG